MAISRTPNKYKGFTFDGVDSKDFGVYISDTGAFNAPERDVEMIEIPGRNGAYALDKGRFSNIEVTYNAFVATDSESDYISGVNALRNALCSRKGYCRLEDEFNPNEYRKAVYKSGLKVSSVNDKAGEFTITFDCQPQRYLKSGETAISVESGGAITNPTLFNASPMIEATGNGGITINDDVITLGTDPIGNVLLANKTQAASNHIVTASLANTDTLNNGDTITVSGGSTVAFSAIPTNGNAINGVSNATVTGALGGSVSAVYVNIYRGYIDFVFTADSLQFTKGTGNTITGTLTADIRWYVMGGAQHTESISVTVSAVYDQSTQKVRFGIASFPAYTGFEFSKFNATLQEINGNSTKPALSGTTYIDLDIGEAYQNDGGSVYSVNNAVSIPAELPALKPGENTISYDSTITQLKIVPRWWEV